MSEARPARRWMFELLLIGALGILAGYLGPFGTFAMPLGERVAYWLLFASVGYALYRPVALLVARWSPRVRVHPALLAMPLMLVPSLPMTALACWTLRVSDAAHPLDALRFAQIYAQTWVMGALTYGMFLLVFARRAPPAPASATMADMIAAPADPADTALHKRLPPGFGPVIALQAEDHYVRVHGEARSVLLLMRLGDAIDEIGADAGVTTHRSWWVARAALGPIDRRGRGGALQLPGGVAVPVARERLAAVRALAPPD